MSRCSARRLSPTPSSSSALQPFENTPTLKPSERAFCDFSKTVDRTPICRPAKAHFRRQGQLNLANDAFQAEKYGRRRITQACFRSFYCARHLGKVDSPLTLCRATAAASAPKPPPTINTLSSVPALLMLVVTGLFCSPSHCSMGEEGETRYTTATQTVMSLILSLH